MPSNRNKIVGRPLYVSLIIFGLFLISLSFFNSENTANSFKNLYGIFANLGSGLLPSGIIGLILDNLKAKEDQELKIKQRSVLLDPLIILIQNFTNEICNQYFSLNSVIYNKDLTRKIKIKYIFETIGSFSYGILSDLGNEQLEDYKETITLILARECAILEYLHPKISAILQDSRLYILNGTFTEHELSLLKQLGDKAVCYLNSISVHDYLTAASEKQTTLGLLKDIISTFDEFYILYHLEYRNNTLA